MTVFSFFLGNDSFKLNVNVNTILVLNKNEEYEVNISSKANNMCTVTTFVHAAHVRMTTLK